MIVRMTRMDRYCGPEELTDPRMVETLTVLSAGLGQQEFIPCEVFIFVGSRVAGHQKFYSSFNDGSFEAAIPANKRLLRFGSGIWFKVKLLGQILQKSCLATW